MNTRITTRNAKMYELLISTRAILTTLVVVLKKATSSVFGATSSLQELNCCTNFKQDLNDLSNLPTIKSLLVMEINTKIRKSLKLWVSTNKFPHLLNQVLFCYFSHLMNSKLKRHWVTQFHILNKLSYKQGVTGYLGILSEPRISF